MLQVKFSNKAVYTVIGILVLLSASLIAYAFNYQSSVPNPGHGADEVLVNVGGNETTLQEAINDGSLGGGVPQGTQCGCQSDGDNSIGNGEWVCKGMKPYTDGCPSGYSRKSIGEGGGPNTCQDTDEYQAETSSYSCIKE